MLTPLTDLPPSPMLVPGEKNTMMGLLLRYCLKASLATPLLIQSGPGCKGKGNLLDLVVVVGELLGKATSKQYSKLKLLPLMVPSWNSIPKRR